MVGNTHVNSNLKKARMTLISRPISGTGSFVGVGCAPRNTGKLKIGAFAQTSGTVSVDIYYGMPDGTGNPANGTFLKTVTVNVTNSGGLSSEIEIPESDNDTFGFSLTVKSGYMTGAYYVI